MAKKKRNPSAEEAGDGEQTAAELGDFETTLGDVETIVRKLESGALTLDDSLKQYEVAVAKMRQCYQLLDVAERKISVLAGVDAEGRPVTEPLENMSGGESLVQKQASRGKRRGAVASDHSASDTTGVESADLDSAEDDE
ncbi:exodeoxyribonuclease VII small subunit [Rhodopirellula baltica]|uniref:Exodeoxyribonuclease 7 small subunit n=1 Tax=Rhodopirellula baltica SWK14 TaxID=993516 RepID=L7CP09_RHOBT|nr:exodeoxyribonuclease VII small subunit [Rhodopirellula baltica]ELP35377.1 exodeoxyribonuclease VII small subunit [Rhodopirellula baltica SWK14]